MPDWAISILSFLAAFFGGGLLTALIGERWEKKRANYGAMHNHASCLVRTYQTYVRLLREYDDTKPTEPLDTVHSEFLAEVKILSFYPELKERSVALGKISQRLFSIRADCKSEEQKRAALSKIYGDFDDELSLLVASFM